MRIFLILNIIYHITILNMYKLQKRFHDSSDEETEERYSSHDKQVAMKPKARSASPEPRPSKSSITTVIRSMSVRTRSSATSSKTTKVVQQQTVQQRVVTGRSMFYGGSNFHSKKSSFTESGKLLISFSSAILRSCKHTKS